MEKKTKEKDLGKAFEMNVDIMRNFGTFKGDAKRHNESLREEWDYL